jgi:hypothetical protein
MFTLNKEWEYVMLELGLSFYNLFSTSFLGSYLYSNFLLDLMYVLELLKSMKVLNFLSNYIMMITMLQEMSNTCVSSFENISSKSSL